MVRKRAKSRLAVLTVYSDPANNIEGFPTYFDWSLDYANFIDWSGI